MDSGIYRITCSGNQKSYIGSAKDFGRRWNQHRWKLNSGKHYNTHLQHSWNKYGPDSFGFEKLLICSPDNMILYEQLCLDALHPELNIAMRAGNTLGTRHPEETREKMRQRAIGRKYPPRSQECRDKLSVIHKGKKKPQHVIDALQAGKARRGITLETRARVSESLKAAYANGTRKREKSEAHKQKIGQFYAKLTDEQVIEIRRLRAYGVTGKELAQTYNSNGATISAICNGKRYRWVT